jgi:hypothetical protein
MMLSSLVIGRLLLSSFLRHGGAHGASENRAYKGARRISPLGVAGVIAKIGPHFVPDFDPDLHKHILERVERTSCGFRLLAAKTAGFRPATWANTTKPSKSAERLCS